ncbi:MAG: hypothetical protein KIT68_04250 [Phycisphaeraceae bacterium]|nr:hypothetical protein [Phycisphaeraceae bacterium]
MKTPSSPSQPLSEADMISRLCSGEIRVPPLDLEWTTGGGPREADAFAKVSWGGTTYRFVAELKGRSIPKAFSAAVEQAKAWSRITGDNPMVVLPYLAPERLEELQRESVSGVDLCGNALVVVPEKLLVLRSGAKNKFRESFPIRDVYRGTTSLVARALLLRPTAASLSDLDQFIRSRGGKITLTTISKALRRMEDDVLIERSGGQARLLQPDELLQKLLSAYRPAKTRRRLLASTRLDRETLCRRISTSDATAVLSGQSSTDRYAVMGREDVMRFYCSSIATIEKSLGSDLRPGDRFANVELLETGDATVYFDARSEGTVPFASPIQTYLELSAGDKREQETADQVRKLILTELKSQGATI